MPIQILIVDDHQIVREGVRSLLKALRPIWNVAEAEDGTQAVEEIKHRKPDVMVMDITMPQTSGLVAAADLRKAGFDRPILIFTMHKSEQLVNDTKKAGAQGYVLKSQAVEDLVQAIDTLLAGGTFYGTPSLPTADLRNPKLGMTFFIGLTPAFDS